jgi:hypothetical protein
VGAGGDRDDLPEALAGHHASRRRLAREERPAQIDLDNAIPFLDVHVENREGWKTPAKVRSPPRSAAAPSTVP